MATKYGIISDTHYKPEYVAIAVDELKDRGVDVILANGDVGNGSKHIARTMLTLGKSGLESWIVGGNHEHAYHFDDAASKFSKRYGNLHIGHDQQKFELGDHTIVFLPGADVGPGSFRIKDTDTESGYYVKGHDCVFPRRCKDAEEGVLSISPMSRMAPRTHFEFYRLFNMRKLKDLITDPEKTILVSHNPAKFDSLDHGTDVTKFWQGRRYTRDVEDWDGDNLLWEEVGIIPLSLSIDQMTENYGATFDFETDDKKIEKKVKKLMRTNRDDEAIVFVGVHDNRGNKDLRDIVEEIGIRKMVTGHFHGCAGKAHDFESNPVSEGNWTQDMFWCASHLDSYRIGLLEVDGENVRYHNVDLFDRIKHKYPDTPDRKPGLMAPSPKPVGPEKKILTPSDIITSMNGGEKKKGKIIIP